METAQELSFDEMGAVLDSIDIPACPAVLSQVMTEAQRDDPDIKVLSRIISSDVGMSAYAIKLANSALFRGSGPVSSVAQAVARLGIRNILCTVVAVSLRNNVIPGIPADVLERFWDLAGAQALAASLIARKVRGVAPDVAYTYALFHHAAIPILMRRFPDYSRDMEGVGEEGRIAREEQLYNCNHAVVGALLARNWGLSPVIINCNRYHHDGARYATKKTCLSGEEQALVAIVHIAESAVEREGTVNWEPASEAIAYLGLDADDLADIVEALSCCRN
jgi:HD-like signal output (HDOD) protein